MTITDAPTETRPARRRVVVTVLLWLLVIPAAVWFLGRAFGLERGILVMLVAFTPYVAAWSWIPVLLALIGRRWAAAAVAALVAFGLAVCVLPRALPNLDTGPSAGVELRVMTANLLFSGADPAEIVRLVRENDIAVLAVQEFTPNGESALAAAGLGDLLPYAQLAPEYGASGSGLYSRHPLTDPASRRNDGGFQQAYGTIQPPGAGPVFVESAHPLAPAHPTMLSGWSADLREQPSADPDAAPKILLGDFNATLDHRLLRDLIATGYRDAADTAGQGLIGTWGPYDGDPIPPVTIDHVLVDERIGVRDVSVHGVNRSDHRALIASLTIPAAS
ncbi:endonuclease/exonuclease/phosphatase family protein [Actinoplanes sp. GCM10030250]|uniref:endonuclease/exonuclease/phosphatase family protein n=1 Tax=Actinoplanes sp. GCM10030250 TaxID=3273376 RepID=UPI00360BEBB0